MIQRELPNLVLRFMLHHYQKKFLQSLKALNAHIKNIICERSDNMRKVIFTTVLLILIGLLPTYAQNPVDVNTASFVQDGDWIYYWNCYDGHIYKVKTDGTENNLIYGDERIWPGNVLDNAGICFDDNYIYFPVNNRRSILKLNKQSGDFEVIKPTSPAVLLAYFYNDILVYSGFTDDGIWSIKTDGTDEIKLSDTYSHCVVGENGYIYYSNYVDDEAGIYKSRVDSVGEIKISDDRTFYMVIKDGWIYYDNRSDDGKLYKMKTDGTAKEKINDDDCYFLAVKDDWIYYTSGQEGSQLVRLNIATLEKQYLADSGYNNINIIGDTVFFSGHGENSSNNDMFTLNMGTGDVKGFLLDKSLFGNGVDLQVLIRGKKIEIENGDVPPLIVDGRSLVPVRAFANMLDIEVDWNEETQTASFTKTDMNGSQRFYNTVKIRPYNDILETEKSAAPSEKDIPKILESEEIKLDVPAALINGRIMVPIRAIAEAFGFKVDWFENNLTAHVFGGGSSWWHLINVNKLRADGDWEKKIQTEAGILTFRDKDDNILLDIGDIEYAKAVFGEISMSEGEWYIELKFTPSGAEKFKAATAQVSAYPADENYLAIYLGEDLISAPRVMEVIDSDTTIITGDFTEEAAKSLTDVITAGQLSH